MTQSVQLLGISNAIVDILAHVEHDFLDKIGAVPGSMTLVDMDRAREIYAMTGPATEMSGGSVANTIAGFANLGGSSAYIGRVKADQLGSIFITTCGPWVSTSDCRRRAMGRRPHAVIS